MAVDPVVSVTVGHLQVLNSDSQWGAGALGSRICGVTHDSEDAGFPGKSCLLPEICITRSDGSVELPLLPLCEELDPETEEMLVQHYLAEAGSIPRRPEPAVFLKTVNLRRLLRRWNRRDYREWKQNAHDQVATLERWFVARHSLSAACRAYYQQCWEGLIEELDSRVDPRVPWARDLLDRLEVIELDPPPTLSPVSEVTFRDFRHHQHTDKTDKPVRSKAHIGQARKRKRRNKKHTSAKVLVHKGVPTLS